jgi:hypothetical protein
MAPMVRWTDPLKNDFFPGFVGKEEFPKTVHEMQN